MAKYRVLKRSFINDSIVEEGAVVEYAGKPGSNLELWEQPKNSLRRNDKNDKNDKNEPTSDDGALV